MRSRCMSLLPRTTLHSDSEQLSLLNPLTTTRNYSYTHFCRFLAVLEYSPIGVKFPPTIAWRILYTVKRKKNWKFSKLFCFESFKTPKNFFAKTRFLILFWSWNDLDETKYQRCKTTFIISLKNKLYVVNIFWLFYCRNLI